LCCDSTRSWEGIQYRQVESIVAGVHQEHFHTKESKEMKPRFVIVMLLILTLAVPATMLAQQSSKTEKEVRAVIEEIRQANLKGGSEAAAFFEKNVADDVVRIPGNGSLTSKADMQNGWKSGTLKVESLEESDITVHIYGKWAIVTGISKSKGTYLGTPFSGVYRWSRVLVKRDGSWKTELYQQTRIAEAAKL
jgi:ketosteroid isomerase-like protein